MKAGSPEKKFSNRWKENLEDVSSLQDAVLQNKEATWGKLHARLGEKPHQKNIVWWLAAACLIFAITISMFIMRQPMTSLTNNNYKNNSIKKPVVKR